MPLLTETDIITKYFQPLAQINSPVPASLAIGDDAALLDIPPSKQLVVSTDNLIAGIHFPEDMPAVDIGKRALAINLSDLAAMGATPAWFTLNISMPAAQDKWLTDFSYGLACLAQEFSCQLIGGNTCRGTLNIAISIYGLVNKGQALQRNQAQSGDDIYVTNFLGDAAAGLQCWQKNLNSYPTLISAFTQPKPCINCGLALVDIATSTIDISDGLDTDLNRILAASNLAATVDIEKLPLSAELIDYCKIDAARQTALTGGDDYQLCFTLPPSKADILAQNFATLTDTYHKIGQVKSGNGIDYRLNNHKIAPDLHQNYQHFPQ